MDGERTDKLVVKGLGAADGTYEVDLLDLVNVGGPRALDNREQHKIKLASGVSGGELLDAVAGLNAAVMVSLAGIILARNGKTVTDQRVWNTRIAYASDSETPNLDDYREVILFVIFDRAAAAEDADEEVPNPPPEAPPLSEKPSPVGGAYSNSTSGHPENGQSPTGIPVSVRSAISDHATSVT